MFKIIYNYINIAIVNKKNFIKQDCYLQKGIYKIDKNYRYIYLDNKSIELLVKKYIEQNNYNLKEKNKIKYFIKKMLSSRSLKLKKRALNFNGQVCLLANSKEIHKEAKIFDFINQLVLSNYIDVNKLEKKMHDYNKFKYFFNIPEIVEFDYDKKISIEKIIISVPKNSWGEEEYKIVINQLFETYIKYYNRDLKVKEKIYKDNIKGYYISDLYQKIYAQIPEEIRNISWPIVLQHGDLWLYNVLLEEKSKKIYIIDWEHSGEYNFLYDIFWWIQNECLYNNNDEYLIRYLRGDYDMYMEEIFSNFSMSYIKKYREYYFKIFLLEVIDKRIKNDSELIQKEVERLINLLLNKTCTNF